MVMLYALNGNGIKGTVLASLNEMPEQDQSATMRVDKESSRDSPEEQKQVQRPIVMNMTMSDWLKLAGYVVGLVFVWFQMDGRVHALELMVAEMRTEAASYERADLSKVRSEGLSDQLREITRRLGTIETKVDNIETRK